MTRDYYIEKDERNQHQITWLKEKVMEEGGLFLLATIMFKWVKLFSYFIHHVGDCSFSYLS